MAPPLRVLCIDDHPDIADSTAQLLRIVGFEARACYDGVSALAEAIRFLPAVCLIDLNMPGMGGDEVAVRIREQVKGLPLVLVAVTAMSNEESSDRIRAAGFDMHLIKPVNPHNLLSIVDRLWQAWRYAMPGSCQSDLPNAGGKRSGESRE